MSSVQIKDQNVQLGGWPYLALKIQVFNPDKTRLTNA